MKPAQFLELLCDEGRLTEDQVKAARRQKKRLLRKGVDRGLIEIVIEEGFISKAEVEQVKAAISNLSISDTAGARELESEIDRNEDGIPTVLDDCELQREIGRGAMSIVYEALETRLNRKVAVKVLPERLAGLTNVERFRREAEAIASLRHDHIVPIYRVGASGGLHYYVMELIEGKTLAECVEDGPLPFRLSAELIRQAALALDYAHEHGIVHRDVKPANIMVDRENQIRITDFGLAIVDRSDVTITTPGTVVGTPMYMSPEQVLGQKDRIDRRSDVYSLGATLYHLLTRELPFESESIQGLLVEICDTEPVPPKRIDSRLPTELETICLKAMSKVPKERYPTASEMAADLQRWLDGEPILASPPPLWRRVVQFVRRHKTAAAVAAAVLIVGLTATAIFYVQARRRAFRQKLSNLRTEAPRLLSEEKPHEALERYSEWLRLVPDAPSAHLGRARAYKALRRFESAEADYRAFLDETTEGNDREAALFELGTCLREQEQFEAASTAYGTLIDEALATSESGPLPSRVLKALYQRGRLRLQRDQEQAAFEDFDLALARGAQGGLRGRLLLEKGRVNAQRRRYQQAQADLDAALEADKSLGAAYYERATLWWEVCRSQPQTYHHPNVIGRIFRDLNAAIDREQTNPNFRLARGLLYTHTLEHAQRADFDRKSALADLRIAARESSDPKVRAQAHTTRALLYEELNRLLRNRLANPAPHLQLGPGAFAANMKRHVVAYLTHDAPIRGAERMLTASRQPNRMLALLCRRGSVVLPANIRVSRELVDRFGRMMESLEEELSAFPRAIEELKAAILADPSHLPARRSLARLTLERGDQETAQRHLSEGLTQKPEDPELLSLRARLHLALGNEEQALRDSEKALSKAGGLVQPRLVRMEILRKLGRGDEVRPLVESIRNLKNPRGLNGELLRFYTVNADGRLLQIGMTAHRVLPIGLPLLRTMRYQSRVSLLAPELPDSLLRRAIVYNLLDMNELALQDLDRAAHLDPYNPYIFLTRGEVRLHMGLEGELDGATRDLQKAVNLTTSRDVRRRGFYALGLSLQRTERYEQALEAYREASRLASPWPSPYKRMKEVYAALGQMTRSRKAAEAYEERFRAYQRVRDAIPELLTPAFRLPRNIPRRLQRAIRYFNAGERLRGQNRYERAIAFYTRAIDEGPELPWAYTARSRVIFDVDKTEFAQAFFDRSRALELHPNLSYDYFKAMREVTAIDRLAGLKGEVEARISAIHEQYPNSAAAHFMRGLYRQLTDDHAGAVEDIERCVELNPSHVLGWTVLGDLRLEEGAFEKARKALERALDIYEQSGTTHYSMARYYSLKKNSEEALSHLRRALELGFNAYEELKQAPALDYLRDNEDFQRLLQR